MPCKTCEYFVKIENDTSHGHAYGLCQRYPPKLTAGEWPTTYKSSWCGEYQYKNVKNQGWKYSEDK